MGPAAKVSLTVALVLPILVCGYGLALGFEHGGNAFFALPLCVFLVLSVAVLPAVWDRAKRT